MLQGTLKPKHVADVNRIDKKTVNFCWGTRWRTLLWDCARSRKVACSVPDFVIWISHCISHPSGITLALGSTQPLGRNADKLITIMCRLPWNMRASNPREHSGPVQACTGILTFTVWLCFFNSVNYIPTEQHHVMLQKRSVSLVHIWCGRSGYSANDCVCLWTEWQDSKKF